MASIASAGPFECPVCGQQHPLSFAFAANAPHAVLAIPEAELTNRLIISPFQCVIDNKDFYLRGRILIPVHGYDEPFVWGVWAEISPKNFLRAHELWNTPGRENEPPFPGYLNTDLPLYGSTMNVEVDVQTQIVGRKPHFYVRDPDLVVGTEQREGITPERLQDINVKMWHPEAGVVSSGA